jgi:hypothetical protein
MAFLSRVRIKKQRERITGRIKYTSVSRVLLRRGKFWIKGHPTLFRKGRLLAGRKVRIQVHEGREAIFIYRVSQRGSRRW